MIDRMDLAHITEEFDSLPEVGDTFLDGSKKEMRKEINEEFLNFYNLWKHVNGKGMIEFFKFIAEAEGYLTAYNPGVIDKSDGLTMLDKDLCYADLRMNPDLDGEELEQIFQLFDEFFCPECDEIAVIDKEGDGLICPGCGTVITPFEKTKEE